MKAVLIISDRKQGRQVWSLKPSYHVLPPVPGDLALLGRSHLLKVAESP